MQRRRRRPAFRGRCAPLLAGFLASALTPAARAETGLSLVPTSPIVVVEAANFTRDDHSLATDGSGRYLVAWNGDGSVPFECVGTIFGRAYDADGTPRGTAYPVISDDELDANGCLRGATRLIEAPTGAFLVHADSSTVAFSLDGARLGGPFETRPSEPEIAVSASGRFGVLSEEAINIPEGTPFTFFRYAFEVFDPSSESATAQTVVQPFTYERRRTTRMLVDRVSGSFVALLAPGCTLDCTATPARPAKVLFFDDDATPLAPELELAADIDPAFTAGPPSNGPLHVRQLADGRFAAFWLLWDAEDEPGLFGRLYELDTTPLAPPFRAEVDAAFFGIDDLAVLETAGPGATPVFVVASGLREAEGRSAAVQAFDTTGAAFGPPRRVSEPPVTLPGARGGGRGAAATQRAATSVRLAVGDADELAVTWRVEYFATDPLSVPAGAADRSIRLRIVTVEPALFTDGFESQDTCGWSERTGTLDGCARR